MIALFKRRSDILLGFGAKNALVRTQKLLNVLPWRHAHCPIIISDKITAEVEVEQTRTLKLKLIFVL